MLKSVLLVSARITAFILFYIWVSQSLYQDHYKLLKWRQWDEFIVVDSNEKSISMIFWKTIKGE